MPMVPVYKLETLADVEQYAQCGGFANALEMCGEWQTQDGIPLTPEHWLGTWGVSEEEITCFDADPVPVGDCVVLQWEGREGCVYRQTHDLFKTKDGQLVALMDVDY